MMTFAPLLLVLLPLAAAGVSFALPERLSAWRNAVNLGVAFTKLLVVAYLLLAAGAGQVFEWRYEFLPGHDFVLRLDPLALLFVTLSVFLWLLTTIYAIAYFDRGPNLPRFFGFFNLCVLAATGVAMSGTAIKFGRASWRERV